jgi:transglutaminase-like putative cysteine protease
VSDHGKWLPAAGLAAVSVTAGLTFSRVFANGSFALPVIIAAGLPHAIGVLGRSRRWRNALIVVATVAALFVFATVTYASKHTTLLVPSPTSTRDLWHLLGDGWSVFRGGHAPVDPTSGVQLLCVAAVGVVALLADQLAFARRLGLGAIVPSLLLFVVAATLGTTDLRFITTVAYVVAVLAYLVLFQQAEVEQRRTWCTGRRVGSSAGIVNAAAALGGGAVLLGVVLGPLLPGANASPVLDYRHLGGPSASGPTSIRAESPIVDIRDRLTGAQSNDVLFHVKSPQRLYWRLAGLDHFDGNIWGIESEASSATSDLPRRPRPGTIREEFTIDALDGQWLPAAYEPTATDANDARVVDASHTLVAPSGILHTDYKVDSRVPKSPTPTQIAGTEASLPDAYKSDTDLPPGFPDSVRGLARRITKSATTPYAKAEALQRYFTGGSFVYDLNVPRGSGTDEIVSFLRVKRGFCEQFAAAYAAMARSLGLPARVAVGFGPGELEGGAFTVRARDAHAWPEVWLAGLGWRAFEPTPAGTQPGQTDPLAGAPTGTTGSATPTTTLAPSLPTTTPRVTFPASPAGNANVQAGSFSTAGTGFDERWLVLAAVPLLALLVVLAWGARALFRKRLRRTRRRRQSVTHARSIAGAWQDALERLAEAGLPPRSSLTPYEQASAYRRRLVLPPVNDRIDELADLYTRAGWSGRDIDEDDVARAWQAADEVRAGLARDASAGERARRALRPVTLERASRRETAGV